MNTSQSEKNLSYLSSRVKLDAAAVLQIERDQEVETLRRPSNCTCSSIDPICICLPSYIV